MILIITMIYNITILTTSLEFIDDINMSIDTYMHRVIPSNNIATVRSCNDSQNAKYFRISIWFNYRLRNRLI